jgi:RimJ/RimL family protein N-acetyltransferase
VKLELVPFGPDSDVAALVDEITPAYRGDAETPRAIFAQTIDLLARDPRPDPWGSYLARRDGTYVGTCAFKSAPDAEGRVEIAYSTFPVREGQGYATAMAGLLTGIALEGGVHLVIAHTLPEENASNRCLRRNGFTFAGEVNDPEDGLVWRWEKRA